MPCFEQTASPAELESYRHSMEVIRNGKCKWCGAPAVGGSTAFSIPGVMEEQSDLWCEPCRLDLAEFRAAAARGLRAPQGGVYASESEREVTMMQANQVLHLTPVGALSSAFAVHVHWPGVAGR
jgi:hypothetical protein